MARRLVSVDDDLTLPAAVKVANENLPAALQPAALNATIGTQVVGGINGREVRRLEWARTDRLGALAIQESIATGPTRPTPLPVVRMNINGQPTVFKFPPNYTPAKPTPLVIHCGGAGTTEEMGGIQFDTLRTAAVNAGYIYATTRMHGNNYGSPNAMADVKAVYDQALKLAPIAGVVLAGESMGGLTAQNVVARNVLPNVLGVFLVDPVHSLRHRYDNGRSGDINAAYGIAGNGSDYDAKTAGFDAGLREGWEFRGVPFYLTASTADTVVPKSEHADVLASKLAGYSPLTYTELTTGDHGDATHYSTAAFTATLNAWTASVSKLASGYDFMADPALLADFDANTLGLANGAAVTSWAPARGTETSPLSPLTTNPTYATNAVNGRAAVVLDVDDILDTGAWSRAYPVPLTFLEVLYHDGANVTKALMTGRSGVYANLALDANGRYSVGAGAPNEAFAPAPTTPGWYVVGVIYNGPNSRIFTDKLPKVNVATGYPANAALPGIKIGAQSSSATTGGYAHKVARIAVIGRALSDTEMAAAMSVLTGAYTP